MLLHHRTFSNISSLHSLSIRSVFPTVITKTISRHRHCPLGAHTNPWLRAPAPGLCSRLTEQSVRVPGRRNFHTTDSRLRCQLSTPSTAASPLLRDSQSHCYVAGPQPHSPKPKANLSKARAETIVSPSPFTGILHRHLSSPVRLKY